MKKLLLAISLLSLGTFNVSAQTTAKKVAPAKTPPTTQQNVEKTAPKGKVATGKDDPAGIQKQKADTSVKVKKDGTPDKRYKENKKLKKDGTPDMRYKENSTLQKAEPQKVAPKKTEVKPAAPLKR